MLICAFSFVFPLFLEIGATNNDLYDNFYQRCKQLEQHEIIAYKK